MDTLARTIALLFFLIAGGAHALTIGDLNKELLASVKKASDLSARSKEISIRAESEFQILSKDPAAYGAEKLTELITLHHIKLLSLATQGRQAELSPKRWEALAEQLTKLSDQKDNLISTKDSYDLLKKLELAARGQTADSVTLARYFRAIPEKLISNSKAYALVGCEFYQYWADIVEVDACFAKLSGVDLNLPSFLKPKQVDIAKAVIYQKVFDQTDLKIISAAANYYSSIKKPTEEIMSQILAARAERLAGKSDAAIKRLQAVVGPALEKSIFLSDAYHWELAEYYFESAKLEEVKKELDKISKSPFFIFRKQRVIFITHVNEKKWPELTKTIEGMKFYPEEKNLIASAISLVRKSLIQRITTKKSVDVSIETLNAHRSEVAKVMGAKNQFLELIIAVVLAMHKEKLEKTELAMIENLKQYLLKNSTGPLPLVVLIDELTKGQAVVEPSK